MYSYVRFLHFNQEMLCHLEQFLLRRGQLYKRSLLATPIPTEDGQLLMLIRNPSMIRDGHRYCLAAISCNTHQPMVLTCILISPIIHLVHTLDLWDFPQAHTCLVELPL